MLDEKALKQNGEGRCRLGSDMMSPSDACGEKLKAFARDRHEFRDTGQIPIGVGDLDVADVGRKRRHGVVDIGAMLVPELNAATDEGVAEVVDAHLAMAAPGGPTEVGAKLPEDLIDPLCAMNPPAGDRNSGASAVSAHGAPEPPGSAAAPPRQWRVWAHAGTCGTLCSEP